MLPDLVKLNKFSCILRVISHRMNTRSRSREKRNDLPLIVGMAKFQHPLIGFEKFEDVAKEKDGSDDNDSAESEYSRESTPVCDDETSPNRDSPLRNASAEPEDNVKLIRVGEYGYIPERNAVRSAKQRNRYVKDENNTWCKEGTHSQHKPDRNISSNEGKVPSVSPGSSVWIYTGVGLLIIVTIVSCIVSYWTREPEPEPFEVNEPYLSKKDLKLEESLDNIMERFPSQDDNVWFVFSAGIKSITVGTPNKPAVFLMLYESNDKTPACLAKEVSKVAISYIMGWNSMPIIVDGVQLKQDEALKKDSGELIVRYNNTVRNKGSLIVTNLHEVPANIAKSFHFFCDTYSPLIEKAVYFFTLSTQGERLPKNKLQRVAEKTIKNLWSDSLESHLLEPLITRLTGYVIRVVPEYNINSCDL